jgi:hypothetical protein
MLEMSTAKRCLVLFEDPHTTPEHHYYDRQLQSARAPLYQDSCQHLRASRRIRAIKQVTPQALFQSCVSVLLSCCGCYRTHMCGGRAELHHWEISLGGVELGSWVTGSPKFTGGKHLEYESLFLFF